MSQPGFVLHYKRCPLQESDREGSFPQFEMIITIATAVTVLRCKDGKAITAVVMIVSERGDTRGDHKGSIRKCNDDDDIDADCNNNDYNNGTKRITEQG